MKNIFIVIIAFLLGSPAITGQTVTTTVQKTGATTFDVQFVPSADIIAKTSAVPYGIVITIPKALYSTQPPIGDWAFTPHPTFGGSPGMTVYNDATNNFWAYRFINLSAPSIPGPTKYSQNTTYVLASFTLPAGVRMQDVTLRDYSGNKIPGGNPGSGGMVITIGGVSRTNDAAVFSQKLGSTKIPSNCGASTCTSFLSLVKNDASSGSSINHVDASLPNITAVKKEAFFDDNLKLYPNPSYGESTTLECTMDENWHTSQVVVQDALGKVVYRQFVALNKGTNQINLPTTDLSTGFYFIRLEGTHQVLAPVKLIKK